MNNKIIGNKTEQDVINVLVKNGFWCSLLKNKIEGQPCDIIASRNNITWMLDAKHCDKGVFEFKRIEDNQKNCFELALKCGNSNVGFAIQNEQTKEIKWLYYADVCKCNKQSIHLSILPLLENIICK